MATLAAAAPAAQGGGHQLRISLLLQPWFEFLLLGSAGSGGLLARGGTAFDHAHDVELVHDQEILTVELDLGARPFPEQHGVADLEIDRDQLAGLVTATRADCGDLTLARLFLGGIGNDRIAARTTNTRKTYMLPSSSCR